MKHIFIVNPNSGKGSGKEKIVPEINEYCTKNGLDYLIHETTCAGDGMNFARQMAETGEHVRLYACGGDGTLFEVVNGAYGHDNAEVAVIPLGSGNDFVRTFGNREELCNVEAQVNGTPIKLDLIRCGDKYAINECSMGMDAEVCAKQIYFKKLPVFNGETAYTASLLWAFTKRVKSTFTITVDDGEPFTDDFLFCLCGNSRWYGGGYKGAPLALPDDGYIDMILVRKKMNRLKILTLINKYKAGQHLDWEITTFKRVKKVTVHSDRLAAVNIDGECEYVNDSTFEMLEKAINFVVPANSTYIEDRKSGKLSGEKDEFKR
ncbi:MAG: diacylglycerol kinase family lipid kinase [Clostridiales bacterium]|nr:diacylglycerol kinase family lipid kinase [Clostridiales bacterium]